MTLRPMPGNVFILPDKQAEHVGLIYIPENRRDMDMPQTGKVVAMGGILKTKKGVLVPPEFKVGDRVIFKKHSGLFVDWKGKRFVQIRHHDIEAILE